MGSGNRNIVFSLCPLKKGAGVFPGPFLVFKRRASISLTYFSYFANRRGSCKSLFPPPLTGGGEGEGEAKLLDNYHFSPPP